MNSELLKTALTIFAGGAGAFWGARIGYNKTKLERSHDKRLEWHRGAHEAVLDLKERATRTVLYPDPGEVAEFTTAAKRFDRIVAEARTYMTGEGARGLGIASMRIWNARQKASRVWAGAVPDADAVNRELQGVDDAISEAEAYILEGLKRLMPTEPEYSLKSRIRASIASSFARRRLKRSHK